MMVVSTHTRPGFPLQGEAGPLLRVHRRRDVAAVCLSGAHDLILLGPGRASDAQKPDLAGSGSWGIDGVVNTGLLSPYDITSVPTAQDATCTEGGE
jgi:hypothetical protein